MMKILICEHQLLVRETFAKCLSEFPLRAKVLQADSLKETVEIITNTPDLDLITVELMMPGMNGVAGINHLHCIAEDIPILVVSGSSRRDDVTGSLQLGASGYISKTAPLSTLIEAAQTVLAGEPYISEQPEVICTTNRAPSTTAESLAEPEELACLTRREREVLSYLVCGMSNKEIARELALEEVTIKIHLHNIYRKLGVSNRTQAVAMALGLGVTPAIMMKTEKSVDLHHAALQ